MADNSWHYLLHADLDAFYASVEQQDNPSIRGKPVVVGGSPENRGVVAAASYEARSHGIRSAMPMKTALQRCRDLVRISPRFARYHEISDCVMDIFRNVTPLVEPVSLDEAYLDITEEATPATVDELARNLKCTVERETGLVVTIGGGSSKTVSKIASQVAKPNGLLLVPSETERSFLEPIDVEMLSGVGPKTADVLRRDGINTLGQLSTCSTEWLQHSFGRRGLDLKERALGIDNNPVTTERQTKSVSAETTMPKDISDSIVLKGHIRELAERVADRLQKDGLQGSTVYVKLRLADFTTFTRQVTLQSAVAEESIIFRAAWSLVKRELVPNITFRLLGVGVTKFQTGVQLTLIPPI